MYMTLVVQRYHSFYSVNLLSAYQRSLLHRLRTFIGSTEFIVRHCLSLMINISVVVVNPQ